MKKSLFSLLLALASTSSAYAQHHAPSATGNMMPTKPGCPITGPVSSTNQGGTTVRSTAMQHQSNPVAVTGTKGVAKRFPLVNSSDGTGAGSGGGSSQNERGWDELQQQINDQQQHNSGGITSSNGGDGGQSSSSGSKPIPSGNLPPNCPK